MENGSQWREVVWGLKSLPESGRKTPQRWWGRGLPCGEKQEREMSFDVFDMFYLDENELGYAFI